MRYLAAAALLPFLVTAAVAQEKPPSPASLTVEARALGDVAEGVATELLFRFPPIFTTVHAAEVMVQGSVSSETAVLKTFRYLLKPDEMQSLRVVEILPAAKLTIEARLTASSRDGSPLILAKGNHSWEVKPTGNAYVSESSDDAQEIVAEGVQAEIVEAVRIRAPRRDVAPNLFIVDVDAKPPVSRVEFYVDEKKIFTKNAAPYRAELDLGELPNRVEIKVIGYDRSGRYIDADAWIVNERENDVEVKLTRTDTKDGTSHIKVSIQNPQSIPVISVELFADDRRVASWTKPPYAVALKTSALAGAKLLRATAKVAENMEHNDVVFLDGSRFSESVDVNLVELPASVSDEAGAPVVKLKAEDFILLEDGKPQKIDNVAFATNLPLSLGILVDHSGSMQPRIEAAREAAMVFARDVLSPRDRAFFGGFSWDAARVSPFVSDADALRAQITNLPQAEGGTALYDAIITGLYRFRGVEGRKALVIVTDGEDTASRVDYDQMLSYARASRTPLYFIGIGMSILGGSNRLKSLAAETGGVAYLIRNTDELEQIYEQIEQELRTQYLVRYYARTTGKTDRRYRKVEIKVSRPDAKVRTVRGFIP